MLAEREEKKKMQAEVERAERAASPWRRIHSALRATHQEKRVIHNVPRLKPHPPAAGENGLGAWGPSAVASAVEVFQNLPTAAPRHDHCRFGCGYQAFIMLVVRVCNDFFLAVAAVPVATSAVRTAALATRTAPAAPTTARPFVLPSNHKSPAYGAAEVA